MDDEVDEGSPLGGIAFAAGLLSVALVVLQLPATYLGVGWVPGCLTGLVSPLAILLGGFSLITEQSPRGRRQAQRGLVLGAIGILSQIAFLMVVVWLIGDDLRGLAVP